MAPDSIGLLGLLGAVAAVAMTVVFGRGLLLLRTAAALLALVTVFVAGAAAVNVYFGYYTSWTDLAAGVGDNPAAPTATVPASGGVLSAPRITALVARLPASSAGTLLSVPMFGRRSHINRDGLVWLPPQYREPAYAHVRFPVLELIPGTPGLPSGWVVILHATSLLARMTAGGRIGPMVVVMAPSNPPVGKGNGQECTNAPGGPQDSTYIGVDVPADVSAAFRVDRPGPHWAVAGYSSGGYCAAELALKHPGTYAAVADLDGYLSPLEDDGLWHRIFHGDTTALQADDIALELPLFTHRLPAFYLAAGTGTREDTRDLSTLATLLRGRAPVTAVTDPGRHGFAVWRSELPAVFTWLWHHVRH